MKICKKILIILSIIFVALLFNKVYAAGVTISVSKQEVEIGSSFTVTITGTGAATYDIKASVSGAGISDTINLNTYTDDLSNATKQTSKTYTAKQKGTVNISIKSGSNVTVAGGRGSQSITGSGKTVSIIDKKSEQAPQQTQTQTPTTTTNKTTKTDKKDKEKVVETKEKEEATPELGIHSLKLIGVKENDEEVEISLDKEFNIKTFDYNCNVANDIKTLKIEKEAYEYNDLVQISGLDEELKIGENTITLKLSNKGKEVIYTIKITKQEKIETDETSLISAEPEQTKEMIVSIPLIWFIILEIAIVIVSVTVTILVIRYLKNNRYNDDEY